MDRDAEARALVDDLTERFPVLPRATVQRLVQRLYAQYEDAPVQSYITLLVRRSAEQSLRELDRLPAGDDDIPVPRLRETV